MESSNASKANTAPRASNKPNKNIIIAVVVAFIIIAAIVVAIIINNKNNEPNSLGEGTSAQSLISEEEKRITEETLKKYAEVTIDGYQDVNDPNTKKAVVVNVKNISNETTSLAVTIGAYGKNDNLLETSSTYAENIEPGQSVTFNTFIFTDLTEDQLNSATFKVYTAKTYTVENTIEAPSE